MWWWTTQEKFDLAPMKWCIAESVIIMIMCAAMGGPVMSQRKKHFNEEYMKQFEGLSRTELHKLPAKLGYPDMGNGKISKYLDLKSWLEFNNTQRTHLNFVEVLPFHACFTLLAALFHPYLSAVCGLVFIVARLVYYFGYIIHPNFRAFGSLPGIISGVVQAGLVIQGLISLTF